MRISSEISYKCLSFKKPAKRKNKYRCTFDKGHIIELYTIILWVHILHLKPKWINVNYFSPAETGG